MSRFSKTLAAATLAATLVGTSLVAAEAGTKERRRNIGIGVVATIVGAAIIAESSRRSHARRHREPDCWIEKRRRWSNHRGRYVVRRVEVCD